MKYTITYACGHEGTIELFGKSSMREYIRDRRAEEPCPDCQAAKRDEQNAESAKRAAEIGLPKLTGSEKQVAWAETIRLKFVNAVDEALIKIAGYRVAKPVSEWETAQELGRKNIEKWNGIFGDYADESPRGISMVFSHMIATKINASFWIDNHRKGLSFLFSDYTRDNLKAIIDYYTTPAETKEEKESSIIKPENIKKSGIADVIVAERTVKALYEKDDAFREIAKGRGLKWDGSSWSRTPSKLTGGDIIDRAAEIVLDLLRAGFVVKVQDADVRAKVLTPDTVVPEQRKWILQNKADGTLAIRHDRDDMLYTRSRSLPGAWYNREAREINIKPTHYAEIRDFARLYGFSIAPGAEKAMQEAEAEVTAALTVQPAPETASAHIDNLEAMLNSSTDIIPDLKDE